SPSNLEFAAFAALNAVEIVSCMFVFITCNRGRSALVIPMVIISVINIMYSMIALILCILSYIDDKSTAASWLRLQIINSSEKFS
ncbi:hypothetical protein PMAYCL1PPCAC_05844, partial [Pristionchus mayeri]